MTTMHEAATDEFAWEVQPTAARWLREVVAGLADRNPVIHRLADVLHASTGTRLIDWIDQLALNNSVVADVQRELLAVGYRPDNSEANVWRHPLGMFPSVVVAADRAALAIRCDSIEDCVAALPRRLGLHSSRNIELSGPRGGLLRTAILVSQGGVDLSVVERHGYRGVATPHAHSLLTPLTHTKQIDAAARHLVMFRGRERRFASADTGFANARELFAAAAAELGTAWACDRFFVAEREYWQSRNHAGQVQYDRQQRLGLGWANHDHHTYRSSRAAFSQLIATLEQMGFVGRERFYAGREAGWGAQVLEQPECGVVIFADVDLSPDEVAGDFAHEPLAERDELGTVGLWCALHGEAFIEAGMHHLECQFDFDAARLQLAELSVDTMAPFTDFPFLKQAFTKGEVWPVDPRRIEQLLGQGRITAEQAERFRRDGALGSHLEILERNDGYKGFNQTGVSEIITRTDPRRSAGT